MEEKEIEEVFLRFFEKKGHKRLPSAPLVLKDDPTLLFTNAGMAQFKSAFLGILPPPALRVTTSQRCLRTSDIEKVGSTPRHLTFFRMLGNFSFGDYFKEQAIEYAWELVTEPEKHGGFGLDVERLWFTIYEKDEEAGKLWEKIGARADRILSRGEDDNFWKMGNTGPCGPCSEILFDFRGKNIPEKPDEEKNEAVEIWNLVFMQYNLKSDGTLEPLPHKNVDTGAGLERLTVVLKEKDTSFSLATLGGDSVPFQIAVFSTGSLRKIYDAFNQKFRFSPLLLNKNLSVAADHFRAAVYAIADGVAPSNQGRGYVVRLLIRKAVASLYRAFLASHTLQEEKEDWQKILSGLLQDGLNVLAREDELILLRQTHIAGVVGGEVEGFLHTLSRGLEQLNSRLTHARGSILSGSVAFELYDTYGFPLELTQFIVAEKGLRVDEEEFRRNMEAQRERARKARREATEGWEEWGTPGETQFEGYYTLACPAEIRFIRRRGKEVQLGLDRTPFYAEQGGQVGDTGWISSEKFRIRITDTQYSLGTILHIGEIVEGEPELNSEVMAVVDAPRREAIRRAHTATHLLHKALREIFGETSVQAGSLVAPDFLRFDYHLNRTPKPDELRSLETTITRWILEKHPVKWQFLPYQEAINLGAVALFGEKYGEIVRMVEIEGVSRELCGGTHLDNTIEVGFVKILTEESIGAGIRRISAVTGMEAVNWAQKADEILQVLSRDFSAPLEHILARYTQWREEFAHLGKQEQKWKSRFFQKVMEEWLHRDEQVLTGIMDELEGKELAEFCGNLVKKAPQKAIALGRRDKNSVQIVLAIGKDFPVKKDATKILAEVEELIGGGSGGRAHFAQAGGNQPKNLAPALEKIRSLLSR
ncbi:MAG: alanine--tRNA ligase [bacterium JZ-2024 1]